MSSKSYTFNAHTSQSDESQQVGSDLSFIGGRPRIPLAVSLPTCSLCGSEQTFFFQVAFPEGTEWATRTLAVFACTSCADEKFLIPEILKTSVISRAFLSSSPKNYCLMMFPTADGASLAAYKEAVQFRRLQLTEEPDSSFEGDKIGGEPAWLQGDESPKSRDDGQNFLFALQILENAKFWIIDGAPKQVVLGLDGQPKRTSRNYYQLFLANRLFLFATTSIPESVWAITQID